MIEAYTEALLAAIAATPAVQSSSVNLEQRGPRAGLIRGDIYFSDGSRLHFRELVELQAGVVRLMYSYHYQHADETLIFRYDDTPHYPELPDFPHHKHIPEAVRSAIPPDLRTVLKEIESTLFAR